MSEFESKLINYSTQDAFGQNPPTLHVPSPEAIEEQRKCADRYHRSEVLRMAFEMLRGSDLASDHQAVIRAARDMLTFINDG